MLKCMIERFAMNENKFETQKSYDTRTPEEVEQDNIERQAGLSDMYALERLQTDARNDIDERKVFDVLDDQRAAEVMGVDGAREQVAKVYSELMSSPESATIHAQEEKIAAQVEAVTGESTNREMLAARVGAEVVNNIADGSADENNRAVFGSEDMEKVKRAKLAGDLLEKIENNEDLDTVSDSTKGRLSNFVQMVRNRGGVEKTSNKDLEEAGRYIEQNPDVQEEIAEIETQSAEVDSQKLVDAWQQGDELGVQHELQYVDDTTRQTVEAYLVARRGDIGANRADVIADVMEMINEREAA